MIRKLSAIVSHLKCILAKDSWKKLKQCDVLMCCHDANRSLEVEGRLFSPIIDSLEPDLLAAGLKVDRLASFGSVLSENKAYGSPRLFNRMWLFFILRRKALAWIARLFGKKSDTSGLRTPYARVLEKTKCRCVIVIGANELLVRAARERGVRVIEVLHGIGYTPIPWGWEQLNDASFPMGVLSLDSVSTKTFRQLESRGVETRQVEHPWYRRFNESIESRLPSQLLEKVKAGNYAKCILVSLAWGYDGEVSETSGILPNGVISEELVEAIRNTKGSVFWFLRLHPLQMRNKFQYRRHIKLVNSIVEENSNTESAISSTCELRAILDHCTGHITMCSNTSYEAAYMGVNTLLMCPTLDSGEINENLFSDLRKEGYTELKICPKSKNIVDWCLKGSRKAKKIYGEGAEDLGQVVEWMLES